MPRNSHSVSGYTENNPPGDDRNRRIDGVSPPQSSFFVVDFILRLLAFVATLVAAIVMGTSKQTVMVPVALGPGGAPILGPLSAKYHYSPAFVFFVAANAVACGYTVLSLILSVAGKRAVRSGVYPNKSAFHIAVADLVMMALVSAAASAATAIGYVGYKGNSHTRWAKVCGIFDRFCHHMAGAIVTSFVGLIVFMILTVMSIHSIYKRTISSK